MIIAACNGTFYLGIMSAFQNSMICKIQLCWTQRNRHRLRPATSGVNLGTILNIIEHKENGRYER